jgi:4-hydroxybenzoate polyprenyltransferase
MNPATGALQRIATFLSLIKFSHSVFALPFALISLLVATQGRPSGTLLLLVVGAAVSARTAAMGFNRLVDRHLDARNPRTRGRELPAGRISAGAVAACTLAAALLFFLCAGLINQLCLLLSPAVLAVLLGYSYAKRFTALAHFWLGLALALAPLGAWLAATGTLAGDLRTPLLLGLAVLTWVTGFDLIYACQDEEFDKSAGLRSIPARWGSGFALRLSAALHVVTVVALLAAGVVAALGWPWWIGLAVVAVLLGWEHRIVSPTDLSRVDAAFFTLNGCVSLLLCAAAAVHFWVR